MTFEDAVTAPGRIVQVWGNDVIDGNRIQMIYRLSDDGAKQLAWRAVPAEQRDALAEELSARGIPIAEKEAGCFFVWIITNVGVEVYSRNSKFLDATGARAEVEDGRTIQRADIARIVAFADDHNVLRGVKAVLQSGEEIPMVTETSFAAEAGAGYNRNDLLMETGWTVTLGVAIAAWAGTSFDNQI